MAALGSRQASAGDIAGRILAIACSWRLSGPEKDGEHANGTLGRLRQGLKPNGGDGLQARLRRGRKLGPQGDAENVPSLQSSEFKQRLDVVIVGRFECGDMAFSRLARFEQACLRPGKTLPSERHDEQIGGQVLRLASTASR
jgi:hypothetical protein